MLRFNIIFRTCDAVLSLHDVPRPFGLDKQSLLKICFLSLYESVRNHPHRIVVIGDRLTPETEAFFRRFPVEIINRELNNELSIRASLEVSLQCPDSEWVYFCEDDYLHRPETFDFISGFLADRKNILATARGKGGDPAGRPLFIHPPDYPDRYLARYRRPSWLFVSPGCHWREVDSVTFTFLAETSSLRMYESVLRRSAIGAKDRFLSRRLFGPRLIGRPALCLSPVPGLSTHMHEPVMTPLGPWKDLCERYRADLARLDTATFSVT